jgi:tetratricopeptide (TPR) repeat protein
LLVRCRVVATIRPLLGLDFVAAELVAQRRDHLVERGKNLEEALQMVRRAVAAEPRNGYYLDSLGWAYFKLGRFQEAERALLDAGELEKKSATIWEHIGDIESQLGRTKDAQSAWKKALSLAEDASRQKTRIAEKLKRARND